MLQRYCDWKPLPGTTFQIPVGRTFFDFRLGGILIEYHPISLKHEFLTDALHHILSASRFLDKDKKAKLLEAVAGEFEVQYAKRRAQVAAAHPVYKDLEVVCLSSQEQFASFIQTFAIRPAPAHEELCREFRRLQKEGRSVVRG